MMTTKGEAVSQTVGDATGRQQSTAIKCGNMLCSMAIEVEQSRHHASGISARCTLSKTMKVAAVAGTALR